MTETESPSVLIAVPGGQETQKWPLHKAREAISRGEIKPHQWAWSPTHKEWKPVAELPELQIAPLVLDSPATVPVMKTQTALAASAPVQVKAAMKVSAPVKVKAPAAASAQARAHKKSLKELVVREESGFGLFKTFVIGFAVIVLAVIGANYFLVDQPLSTNLIRTPYSGAPVHAHLGAFFQPNSVVIHLRPTDKISAENVADFLISLAQSTPTQPFSQQTFASVGLTSAWFSQYFIAGNDWQTLGQMTKSTDVEKKDFLLTHTVDAKGAPLLSDTSIQDQGALTQRRDQAWASFVATLVHS